jgi:hypothetical protein
MLWAGRLVTIAAIPIYFLAFVGVLRGKRVTFKTTPKGGTQGQDLDRLSVFAPHMALVALLAAGLGLGAWLGHTIWVFMAWGAATCVLFTGFTAHLACRRAAAATRRWRQQAPVRRRRQAPPPFEVHHQGALPPAEFVLRGGNHYAA